MKNLKQTLFHHQPAFLIFLILLLSLIGSSICAPLLVTFSPLQIALLATLVLLVATGLLWFVLTAKLVAERSAYQRLYQLQLKEKLDFKLEQNGTLTDNDGNPVPLLPTAINDKISATNESRNPDFSSQDN